MTKRILVVLDHGPDTDVATGYAVEIARAHDGAVTGLALVDRTRIDEAALGSGIGSMYFAEKLRHDLTAEARSEAQQLLHTFVRRIEAAGVRHTEDHVAEDDVAHGIVEDMKTHDLLIVGHEARLFYTAPDRPTNVLTALVETSAAATLVVEGTYRPIRKVLVAYDGGVSAARAMQKFAHLRPFGVHLDVEVVHVHGGPVEESDRIVRGARAYLEAYGFGPVAATSLPDGSARDRLLKHSVESNADLIVAGSYSASGLKKFLLGSTTKRLIKESGVPLFLYH